MLANGNQNNELAQSSQQSSPVTQLEASEARRQINDDWLMPWGETIAFFKRESKKAARVAGMSHSGMLNQLCREKGFRSYDLAREQAVPPPVLLSPLSAYFHIDFSVPGEVGSHEVSGPVVIGCDGRLTFPGSGEEIMQTAIDPLFQNERSAVCTVSFASDSLELVDDYPDFHPISLMALGKDVSKWVIPDSWIAFLKRHTHFGDRHNAMAEHLSSLSSGEQGPMRLSDALDSVVSHAKEWGYPNVRLTFNYKDCSWFDPSFSHHLYRPSNTFVLSDDLTKVGLSIGQAMHYSLLQYGQRLIPDTYTCSVWVPGLKALRLFDVVFPSGEGNPLFSSNFDCHELGDCWSEEIAHRPRERECSSEELFTLKAGTVLGNKRLTSDITVVACFEDNLPVDSVGYYELWLSDEDGCTDHLTDGSPLYEFPLSKGFAILYEFCDEYLEKI